VIHYAQICDCLCVRPYSIAKEMIHPDAFRQMGTIT